MSSPVISSGATTASFDFGANWTRFLKTIDDARIDAAVNSLKSFLRVNDLTGQRFLDAGSGSGLFSLAARKLGAEVTSFDINPRSVNCTAELRRRYFENDPQWSIQSGSLLDPGFMNQLGQFDVVYSWGVVHHTGRMWDAVDHLCGRVADNGRFWLAIYNDQGTISRNWTRIKAGYNRMPDVLKTPYVIATGGVWTAWNVLGRISAGLAAAAVRLLTIRSPREPLACLWNDLFVTPRARGMHAWHDLVDWIGGYPFEVAKPETGFLHLQERGFSLENLVTCGGGIGCNEFLFRRTVRPR